MTLFACSRSLQEHTESTTNSSRAHFVRTYRALHRNPTHPETAFRTANMPYSIAELREEWLALQKETQRLWSAHARHARDVEHAQAVVKLSRAELDRLSLLLKTTSSEENAALYDMLIQLEQLRLRTAEAKLAQSEWL